MFNNKFTMMGRKTVVMLATLFLVSGCSTGDMDDLEEFVADAYKDKKPEIEPLPEIQPYKGFAYSAPKINDPFNPSNIVSKGAVGPGVSGVGPDANRRREPLEAYPLDALRMVGTMEQETRPWVVIKTSDGRAHRATIGNYMGQNEGKIKQIKLDEATVVLTELVRDASGRWVSREETISIDD